MNDCWHCGAREADHPILLTEEAEIHANDGMIRAYLCDYCDQEQVVKLERDVGAQERGLEWVREMLARV